MLSLIHSYRTENWGLEKLEFLSSHETLMDIYASKRTMRKMPVRINGENFTFSPGKHNKLQKAIIEEFAPRFAPDSECLYVGDIERRACGPLRVGRQLECRGENRVGAPPEEGLVLGRFRLRLFRRRCV